MFEDFDFYEAACHHLNMYKQSIWLAPFQYPLTDLINLHTNKISAVEDFSSWRQRFDAAYDRACSEANFKRIIDQNGKI